MQGSSEAATFLLLDEKPTECQMLFSRAAATQGQFVIALLTDAASPPADNCAAQNEAIKLWAAQSL
jgi:hypothetical protein